LTFKLEGAAGEMGIWALFERGGKGNGWTIPAGFHFARCLDSWLSTVVFSGRVSLSLLT
jgi:hypothetical protein